MGGGPRLPLPEGRVEPLASYERTYGKEAKSESGQDGLACFRADSLDPLIQLFLTALEDLSVQLTPVARYFTPILSRLTRKETKER
jgi:hypothetical protein